MKMNPKTVEFLKANKVWHIATYGDKGAHVVPGYHTEVLDDATVMISAVFFNETLANIAKNNSVAISVCLHKPGGLSEGYELRGTASLVTEGRPYEIGKALVGEKPIPYQGALVVNVLSGKFSGPGQNLGKSIDGVEW